MNEDPVKQSILIVDDSPINIKMLGETLTPDYDISVTTNGPEALEIAASEYRPDLVLLDIMMPGMDGYEVCRRLKSDNRTRNIPVIFITARAEEEGETKGFELGAVDYITKPFSPAIVRARVGTHLDLKLYRDRLEDIVRERTSELTASNEQLQLEIAGRMRAQEELRKSHDELERRVEERTAELSKSNALLKQEICERKRSEAALKENEEYLRTIMATIQTGVIIIDPRTRKIIDANPWASAMVGYRPDDLIGSKCREFESPEGSETFLMPEFCGKVDGDDCELETVDNKTIHVRRSSAMALIRDHEYYIHSYLDITDIRELMKKQEVNIDLAKNMLSLVNGIPPSHIPIGGDRLLYVEGVSLPCYAEGGDHFFVRPFKNKTVLSLKDQSGHEVSCVLRSIITDLIHNALLMSNFSKIEETVARLNDEICRSGFFNPEDFFTAINAEINHETLKLKYLSAGHPPFLLIRGDEVTELPEPGGAGINVPIAAFPGVSFTFGEIELEKGDRLIFYTDGLTEMPLRNTREMIRGDELKLLARKIVAGNSSGGNFRAAVSDIMHGLLDTVSGIAMEEIDPNAENGPKNSSGDDITILGIEIEAAEYEEIAIKPENSAEIAECINSLYEKFSCEWKERGYKSVEKRLHVVLEESILNAWKHGNKRSRDKAVTIRWRFGNRFHLEILDEGEGFDVDRVPDPTLTENITKPGGRGLFIMRHYADSIEYIPGTGHLIMSFAKNVLPFHKKNDSKKMMNLWVE